MYLIGKRFNLPVHQWGYGADTYFVGSYDIGYQWRESGAHWCISGGKISVYRAEMDLDWTQFRVLVWQLPS